MCKVSQCGTMYNAIKGEQQAVPAQAGSTQWHHVKPLLLLLLLVLVMVVLMAV